MRSWEEYIDEAEADLAAARDRAGGPAAEQAIARAAVLVDLAWLAYSDQTQQT